MAETQAPSLVERLEELAARRLKAAEVFSDAADSIGKSLAVSAACEVQLCRDAVAALEAQQTLADRYEKALSVIANASERSETMFGGKMSEVTRVFEHITRVSRQALSSSQGRHEGGER